MRLLPNRSTEVLVVGSGAAGLRAAIAARQRGLEVWVLSKGSAGKGTSTLLSGAVFAGTEPGDSTEKHLEKTLQTGRGINQRGLVEVLVREGPSRLQELMSWGIGGRMHRGYLFAQGRPFVWGEEIIRCLLRKARALGVQFIERVMVAKLMVRDGMAGLLTYSAPSDEWSVFSARALVLATGGASALYQRHDNPQRMMGDGYALALEAGALLQDMEFVQSYPLVLDEPGRPAFLIPPRLADAGRLVNGRGEDILAKYGIEERPAAERARDRLSQALSREMQREGEKIWLDLRGVAEETWLADPFSASTREILGERYGARHHPVRVAPATHHVMGGVCIDPHGRTSVEGMFAAGEVTGGLHGANRMGGNALTETVVFGTRAGEAAAAWAAESRTDDRKALAEDLSSSLPASTGGGSGATVAELTRRLREVLWRDGGILRNREGLARALDIVAREILAEVRQAPSGEGPREKVRAMELGLGARTATLILQAALRREESRGAHFREDFPEQDDEGWTGHLQVRLSPGGEEWTFRPISD